MSDSVAKRHKATLINRGLNTDDQRARAKVWSIVLNKHLDDNKKFLNMEGLCGKENIHIIDLDVPRSLHELYENPSEKKLKQEQLSIALKKYFGYFAEGSYYQGMNDIMGFLLNVFTEEEALVLLEGIDQNYLFDFIYLPFSECLVPILDSICDVVEWKKPDWDPNSIKILSNSMSSI